MKSICQLQLWIYYYLSFDCLPLPTYDPSLLPRGKSKNIPDAIRCHTKTVDCI